MLVFSAGYVAGFVDPDVSNRSDLFDVYVNLPDSVITVSQSAKGTMCSKGKQCVCKSTLIPQRVAQHFSQTDVPYPSTESMAMGKLHKEIGQLIVQSTEDPERSDSQAIKVRIPKRVCIQF